MGFSTAGKCWLWSFPKKMTPRENTLQRAGAASGSTGGQWSAQHPSRHPAGHRALTRPWKKSTIFLAHPSVAHTSATTTRLSHGRQPRRPSQPHTPVLMFLQARARQGCCFVSAQGGSQEAKCLKQVGQEPVTVCRAWAGSCRGAQSLGGMHSASVGCTVPQWNAQPQGGMHSVLVGCTVPRQDAQCHGGMHKPP